MKKITIISLISALSCSPLAFAGGMGDSDMPYCLSTFFSLEFGYSNNTINDFDLVLEGTPSLPFTATKSTQAGSGRLAVGVSNKIDELGLSAEMGWGIYGNTTVTATSTDIAAEYSNKYTLTGVDILAGIAWVPSNFSLFLKAGAMIENMSTKQTTTLNTLGLTNILILENNQTAALPEIKIGGTYNFSDNWALSVAGAYVFGSSNRVSGTVDLNGNLNSNVTINNRNPSIGTVLVGLQYAI